MPRGIRTSSRNGGGGISFTYTETEERRFERRRVMRELLPLLAEGLAEVVEDQLPMTAEGADSKVRAARGASALKARRVAKLRHLAERLRAATAARRTPVNEARQSDQDHGMA